MDAVVERAVAAGAELERAPADQPYGRTGVVRDPFGHRWMAQTPPARAPRTRHGDVGYLSILVPDTNRARAFYGALLGWRFGPGDSPGGWNVEGTSPVAGIGVGQERSEVQLCFRVAHVDAAVATIRERGGEAEEPQRAPYGRIASCRDDQGLAFQVWQPAD